jgi:hypothetical protein
MDRFKFVVWYVFWDSFVFSSRYISFLRPFVSSVHVVLLPVFVVCGVILGALFCFVCLVLRFVVCLVITVIC